MIRLMPHSLGHFLPSVIIIRFRGDDHAYAVPLAFRYNFIDQHLVILPFFLWNVKERERTGRV